MVSERAMSFGAIADDYDRLRPAPPPAVVDWLVPENCQLAVDLAAGTGLLARALATKAAQVLAVEPDPRMAAVLLARSPGVRAVRGRAEAIGVRTASADGLFISSAWHWVDPQLAVPEIARVLRDGGRFGVIWTGRDRDVDWVREIDELREFDALRTAVARATGDRRPWRREVVLPDGELFWQVSTESFRFTRTMTIADLADVFGTYSYLLVADPTHRDASLRQIRAVLDRRFAGARQVDVPMRSWCWRADRVPR